MEKEIYLSVIIPAYNEQDRLPKTLDEIWKYLKERDYESEIIVVDNGSTDRTPDIVKEKAKEIRNLILIENPNGKGKGEAVKIGMLKAKGKFRIFTDADNSTSIDQIEKMWSEFEKGYDVVIGSRDVKGAILDPPQPWIRKEILGKGFRLYRKLILDLWEIEDTQCGFKCFKEEVAKKVFSLALIKGFAFDPEILLLAKKMGFKIKEIPVLWRNDPHSKVRFKNVIEMALELLKIRWYFLTKKYKI